MKKRSIIFGSYDTATHGWTLTGWKFSEPAQKTNYIDKPGGDGSWDVSDVLSDGIPRYKDRTLTVTLEISEGDRAARAAEISGMVNALDGMRMKIYLPDDASERYIEGRVRVKREYNDLAHGAVTVTATCAPWRYAIEEKVVTVKLSADATSVTLTNTGRLAVVPVITLETPVTFTYGRASVGLQAGSHKWPALVLTPGDHVVTLNGAAGDTVMFKFREAVLE